jgi:hypothetical protein
MENAAGTEKVLSHAWDTKRDNIKFDFESIIIAAGKLSLLNGIYLVCYQEFLIHLALYRQC